MVDEFGSRLALTPLVALRSTDLGLYHILMSTTTEQYTLEKFPLSGHAPDALPGDLGKLHPSLLLR